MSNPCPGSSSRSAADGPEEELRGAGAPEGGDELEPSAAEEETAPSRSRLVAAWILALCCAAVLASALQIASRQREHGFFLLSLCFVVCGAAAFSDVATRRISNVLTYPAIVLGLALNGAAPKLLAGLDLTTAQVWLGSSGTIDCLKGFGLCAAIGVVSFMARGLGGGDAKLLGAVGALIGFDAVIAVLFNTLLIAAAVGLANWALGGSLLRRLQGMTSAVYFSVIFRTDLRGIYGFKPTESPFGLSLLLGLALAQFVALHRVLLSVGW